MKKFKVAVPSGIGDFSWMWVKLSTIKDAEFEFFVPDAWPYRTKQYIDLLPGAKGSLGQHNYNDIKVWEMRHRAPNWEKLVKTYDEGDFIYLQANEHLGRGLPLVDWMPDLEANFHYFLPETVSRFKLPRHCIGVHFAAIKGIRNWKAWMPETWAEFMTLVSKSFPDVTFVMLGGIWDLDSAQEVKGLLPEYVKYIDLVGKTTISEVIKILRDIEYYIGYSSGLNCMRNVLNKPQTTLWPAHQIELMYSWVDPENIHSRDYMGFTYDAPDRIFTRVKNKLKEVMNAKPTRECVKQPERECGALQR
jgi:hypothetical protein